MKINRKWLIIIVIAAIVLALGAVVFYRIQQKPKAAANGNSLDLSAPVVVMKPSLEDISESLEQYGTVQGIKEVSLYSTVPGKIKSIQVQEGARVKRGQVTLYVDRDEAGLKFSDAAVESTIQGIVKKVNTEVGASITASMPLIDVVDMDAVEVAVNIPEKDIARVALGQKGLIRLISYPDQEFSGTVYKLSPVVDPVSRTREAMLLVPNEEHILKPGMFGNVEIILRTARQILVVPSSAVLTRDDKQVIFIFDKGKAVRVAPGIELIKGEKTALRFGVDRDSRVIVVGQHNLKDGDPVRIVEERS